MFEEKITVPYYACAYDMRLSPHRLFDIFMESSSLNSSMSGMSNQKVMDLGYTWMLYKWKMEIYNRPRPEDEVLIRTWVSSWDRLRAYRDHSLLDTKGQVLAKGSSIWTIIDLDSMRPALIPDEIKDAYSLEEGPNFENFAKFKNQLLDGQGQAWPISLSDLDYNRHVNSGSSLRFIIDSNNRDYQDLKAIEIHYKGQIFYEDEIIILSQGEDQVHQQIVKDREVLVQARTFWQR